MDDLHSINDAINKRVGRNLVTSTIVGVLLLVVVFVLVAVSGHDLDPAEEDRAGTGPTSDERILELDDVPVA